MRLIESQFQQSASPALEALSAELQRRYGSNLAAILYYGSCLRQQDELEGVVDLYVVLDGYRGAFRGVLGALGAAVLPPTVCYVEVPVEDAVARCKYYLVSARDFRRGTSAAWFHSYLWARFAQPCSLLYARDEYARSMVLECLAQAPLTFMGRSVPLMPERFDAALLWRTSLALSYQAELRPEHPGRADELYASNPGYYEALTEAALDALPFEVSRHGTSRGADGTGISYGLSVSGTRRRLASLGWSVRRLQGKLLSVLRWVKAAFSFQGGLDYAVWKLERHSGTRIELPPRVRRYPWLFIWGELWRHYRRGTFR